MFQEVLAGRHHILLFDKRVCFSTHSLQYTPSATNAKTKDSHCVRIYGTPWINVTLHLRRKKDICLHYYLLTVTTGDSMTLVQCKVQLWFPNLLNFQCCWIPPAGRSLTLYTLSLDILPHARTTPYPSPSLLFRPCRRPQSGVIRVLPSPPPTPVLHCSAALDFWKEILCSKPGVWWSLYLFCYFELQYRV